MRLRPSLHPYRPHGGRDLTTVHDATYAAGQTGLTLDTWSRATFDDYAATPHA